jgi:23S rRNA (uracil1939-C5)-methyltransferase
MLQVGDILELVVEDIAFGGDGVARHERFVVFVPFTIPSERVRARVTTVKKNFASAQLLEVLAPSPHRVAPPCPHFGAKAQPLPCGGCQYQHIEYSRQLEVKSAQICESLRRIGGIEHPPLEKMIPSPRAYGYRNKITLHRRGNRIGYLAADNATLLDIETCPLADAALNDALGKLRASRAARHDCDVTLRHCSDNQVITVTEVGGASRTTWVEEIVMDRKLKLPPAAFFQVNAELTPTMVRLAREMFVGRKCRALVDAYCGVGLFALFLAEHAESVVGIESDALAIQAAQFNAERLGLKNCSFSRGSVESLLPKTLAKSNPEETCVLLDPPRAGCESSVLEAILKTRPKQIIYISCNPPALARDLKKLLGHPPVAADVRRQNPQNPPSHVGGYKLTRIVPLDMFPQTAHCEVMAELIL